MTEQVILASKYDITIPSEDNIIHVHVTQSHRITVNQRDGHIFFLTVFLNLSFCYVSEILGHNFLKEK